MKTRILFLSVALVCFHCFAQRAQTVTGLTQVSGTAVNASTYMNTVLTNETAAATRTSLGIVDLVGTNGILLSSSNLVSLDTTLYVQSTIDSTNHILDASKFKVTLTPTNDIYFVYATNLIAGATEGTLRILASTTNRNLYFPSTWVNLGAAAPTSIASNKVGLLAWQAYGTNQTDIVYGYAVQP